MIKNGFILSPTAVLSTVPRAKQLYTKSYFFLKLNLKGKSENSKNCKAIIFMRTKALFSIEEDNTKSGSLSCLIKLIICARG